MKLIWGILALILIIVLVPGILSLGIRRIPSGFQPSLSDTEILYKGITATQSFTALNDRLSAIALTVKNPYMRNKKDLQFVIVSDSGESRTVTINGSHIPDGEYLYFSFEPFINSNQKNFIFTISSPTTEPSEAFELYHSGKQFNGNYIVNGLTKPGSLSFVSYYNASGPIASIITIYRNWLTKLFHDLPFAIFYIGIMGLISAYLVLTYSKSKFR